MYVLFKDLSVYVVTLFFVYTLSCFHLSVIREVASCMSCNGRDSPYVKPYTYAPHVT
jgi:hypothetical protein